MISSIRTPATIAETVALAKDINDDLRAKGYLHPSFTIGITEDGQIFTSGHYDNPDSDGASIYRFEMSRPDEDFGEKVAAMLADIKPLTDLRVETLNRKMADVIEFAEKVGLAAPELDEAADMVAGILRAHMANNLLTEVAS